MASRMPAVGWPSGTKIPVERKATNGLDGQLLLLSAPQNRGYAQRRVYACQQLSISAM